jgi:hypothetical protein
MGWGHGSIYAYILCNPVFMLNVSCKDFFVSMATEYLPIFRYHYVLDHFILVSGKLFMASPDEFQSCLEDSKVLSFSYATF